MLREPLQRGRFERAGQRPTGFLELLDGALLVRLARVPARLDKLACLVRTLSGAGQA
jgi:hypothetical protein